MKGGKSSGAEVVNVRGEKSDLLHIQSSAFFPQSHWKVDYMVSNDISQSSAAHRGFPVPEKTNAAFLLHWKAIKRIKKAHWNALKCTGHQYSEKLKKTHQTHTGTCQKRIKRRLIGCHLL